MTDMAEQVNFKIQNQDFVSRLECDIVSDYEVNSFPRPYHVVFPQATPAENLSALIKTSSHPLLLIDAEVERIYFATKGVLPEIPCFRIRADEEAKKIDKVLEVIEWLESQGATKASMLIVVGGGVLQDVGAFAAYLFKRGIPWTLVPTTLLAQGDSCIGGKTALNFKNTKNLLGLFSAPRRVVIDIGYLNTLSYEDRMSGIGEIFRLCITGGLDVLHRFEVLLPGFQAGNETATRQLIASSLSIKRTIIEFDEFELDIRRSLNYGHSFGHALEALTDYTIPHGIAVTIGILVENEISFRKQMLSAAERDRMIYLGKRIIPVKSLSILAGTSLEGIIDLLRRDKKTHGAVLKLATLVAIGDLRFIDLELDRSGLAEMSEAVAAVLRDI